MKKVYLVRGSEDGVLGIYTNIKRAYEVAGSYGEHFDIEPLSYAKTCKHLRQHLRAVVVNSHDLSSVIEVFYLNN
jgi:hypothetical protein